MNETDTGLNRYLREIGRFPLLEPHQEIELARKIKKGDARSREQLINSLASVTGSSPSCGKFSDSAAKRPPWRPGFWIYPFH